MRWSCYLTTIVAVSLAVALSGPITGQPQASPMEAASKLITDAQTSFSNVQDYTEMFYKQERLNGTLQPEQTIQVSVRQQPFSVYMKWVGPKNLVGQEACFVAGKNNNMLRAKASSGLASALGFLSVDPRDPRVMANSRHPITEAGMSNLIRSLGAYVQGNCAQPGQAKMTFAEYRFLQKLCTRMEITHLVQTAQLPFSRKVVYFDRESHLPVRVENYDWPKQPGTPGELLECYSHVDLKFNVGLADEAFNY